MGGLLFLFLFFANYALKYISDFLWGVKEKIISKRTTVNSDFILVSVHHQRSHVCRCGILQLDSQDRAKVAVRWVHIKVRLQCQRQGWKPRAGPAKLAKWMARGPLKFPRAAPGITNRNSNNPAYRSRAAEEGKEGTEGVVASKAKRMTT